MQLYIFVDLIICLEIGSFVLRSNGVLCMCKVCWLKRYMIWAKNLLNREL